MGGVTVCFVLDYKKAETETDYGRNGQKIGQNRHKIALVAEDLCVAEYLC